MICNLGDPVSLRHSVPRSYLLWNHFPHTCLPAKQWVTSRICQWITSHISTRYIVPRCYVRRDSLTHVWRDSLIGLTWRINSTMSNKSLSHVTLTHWRMCDEYSWCHVAHSNAVHRSYDICVPCLLNCVTEWYTQRRKYQWVTSHLSMSQVYIYIYIYVYMFGMYMNESRICGTSYVSLGKAVFMCRIGSVNLVRKFQLTCLFRRMDPVCAVHHMYHVTSRRFTEVHDCFQDFPIN